MTYTKVRKDGWTLNQTTSSISQDWPGLPIPTAPNTSSGHFSWPGFFGGDYNPFWKQQVRQVTSATTAASGTSWDVSSLPYCFATHQSTLGTPGLPSYSSRFYEIHGEPLSAIVAVCGGLSLPQGVVDSLTVNRVTARTYSRFLEKAKSAISSFESGQDLVEWKQTLESVIHPVTKLRQHVLSYFTKLNMLSKRIKTPTALASALSDAYLEWTFGWNPLTADIADGIVGLTNMRLPTVPIEATSHEDYSFLESTSSGNTTTAFVKATMHSTARYTKRLKGVVNTSYQPYRPIDWVQEAQLEPEDFLPTAWDLLPYSFVIDYFLNIGDCIRGFSFPTAAVRWVCMTSRDTTRTVIAFDTDQRAVKIQFPPQFGYKSFSEISCANLDVSYKTFTRVAVSPSDLIPPLAFSIPVSAKPWENMAALILGNAKRLSPFY